MAPRKRPGTRSARPSPDPQTPTVIGLKLPAPGRGDPTYALEKFDDCMRILATHAGPLRVRLREALYPLAVVSARDLPESLRPEFEDIWRQTNKNPSRPQQFVRGGPPADGESGTIDATVHFMRTKTLVRMAERLHDLAERLDALIRHPTSGPKP